MKIISFVMIENCEDLVIILMMLTLNASVARNATAKCTGPKEALAAIGAVTETTTMNIALS